MLGIWGDDGSLQSTMICRHETYWHNSHYMAIPDTLNHEALDFS